MEGEAANAPTRARQQADGASREAIPTTTGPPRPGESRPCDDHSASVMVVEKEVRRVRVQTVLHRTPIERVARLGAALVAGLPDDGSIELELAIGDCSPARCLDDAGRARVTRALSGRVPLTYRWFDANLGHGGGQNALASLAPDLALPGHSLLLLNPDVVLAPDALVALVESLESDPTTGMAEARQLPLEHPKDYDPISGETDWCAGAAVLIRGAAFVAAGGFDEASFFMYLDDVDLSWRLRSAGWSLRHVPGAVAWHDKRLTPSGGSAASDLEWSSSVQGELALRWKWLGEEAALARLRELRNDDDARIRAGAAAFEKARAERRLPEPSSSGGASMFVDGRHARLRFTY